jgi:fructokinase
MNTLPKFVAAGEALTDLLRLGPDTWSSQVGGSTWNVARVVARLGIQSAFAGAVSRDIFGQALVSASAEAGLDLRFLQQVQRSPLLAIVHRTDPPDYFFVGDDSADLYFDAKALPQDWSDSVEWVHFGGISLARKRLAEHLVELATTLKSRGVAISYDPNFRAIMDAGYDQTLQRMMALADLVKVSDEDLRGLFRCDDADLAFDRLRAMNPAATYLYTQGAGGARLHRGELAWHAPAPEVQVIDTVGAGDTSMGALLYSLMSHPARDGGEHLRFCVAAAALACTRSGAAPPTLQEIEALLRQ